jgi:ubiquinone/menaquinone biosynthesis C-methylase UbiE
MEEIKEWSTEYKKNIEQMFGGWDNYVNQKLKLRRPMIKQIKLYATKGKPIIECGTGTGKLSTFFAQKGYKAFGIDIDDDMLQMARNLSEKLSPNCPVEFINANIKNIPFNDKTFSIAHSSGVLEHYSDNEIKDILNEEMRIADTVVFAVPSQYFPDTQKMHGDERFLTHAKWVELIKDANAKILADTSFHLQPINKRLRHFSKYPNKIFAPKAMHLFTIKEREEVQ